MASYHENREMYYDKVIQLHTEGKSAYRISKMIPISNSTVDRWIAEYHKKNLIAKHTDTNELESETFKAMQKRITLLQSQLEIAEMKVAILSEVVALLKSAKLM